MSKDKLLFNYGLSENEAKIYLALLEKGPGTVSDIAKNTGLHRPTVYNHLPYLQTKGLLTTARKVKRVLYVAESPKKLERLLDQINIEARALLPELVETFEKRKHKPVVKFYEGRQGIREVFDDILNTLKKGDVFYRYSSRKEPMNDWYLPKDYRKRRDAKQLERLVIANETYAKGKKTRFERQIKIVPESVDPFDYDVTLIIYADKIAMIDFNSDTAFVMENPKFARFQQALFQLLYKNL